MALGLPSRTILIAMHSPTGGEQTRSLLGSHEYDPDRHQILGVECPLSANSGHSAASRERYDNFSHHLNTAVKGVDSDTLVVSVDTARVLFRN